MTSFKENHVLHFAMIFVFFVLFIIFLVFWCIKFKYNQNSKNDILEKRNIQYIKAINSQLLNTFGGMGYKSASSTNISGISSQIVKNIQNVKVDTVKPR
tara:strand:- start:36 stop:332 length:297 start_codon:yes stop_codon:yes gene_type:complete